MENKIIAKLFWGLPLTREERAYFLLFMAQEAGMGVKRILSIALGVVMALLAANIALVLEYKLF